MGLLDCPLLVRTKSGSPMGAFAGTTIFIWYKPIKHGAIPENCTVAGIPPIVTLGIFAGSDVDSGSLAAGLPVSTVGNTSPRPVANRAMTSPRCTGFADVTMLKLEL